MRWRTVSLILASRHTSDRSRPAPIRRPRSSSLRCFSTAVMCHATHAEFKGFTFECQFPSTGYGRFPGIIAPDREDFCASFEEAEFGGLDRATAHQRGCRVFA